MRLISTVLSCENFTKLTLPKNITFCLCELNLHRALRKYLGLCDICRYVYRSKLCWHNSRDAPLIRSSTIAHQSEYFWTAKTKCHHVGRYVFMIPRTGIKPFSKLHAYWLDQLGTARVGQFNEMASCLGSPFKRKCSGDRNCQRLTSQPGQRSNRYSPIIDSHNSSCAVH